MTHGTVAQAVEHGDDRKVGDGSSDPRLASPVAVEVAGSSPAGSAKQKIPAAQLGAYLRACELPEGTKVEFDGKPAWIAGMTGNLITLQTAKRTIYIRATDPRVLEIKVPA